MPIDYRLVQTATFQSKFEDKSPGILAYVKANPGQSLAAIAAGAGESEADTAIVLRVLDLSNSVVSATGAADELVYWHASDWSNAIETNLAAARTWQASNNGGLMSQMAVDIGVSYEIAEQLGWILEYEGSSKRADV